MIRARSRAAAVLAGLLVGGIALGPVGPSAAATGSRASRVPGARYVPGELLVRYRPAVAASRRAEVRASLGTRLDRRVARAELVRLEAGRSVEQAVAAYRDRPEVLWAEPNYIWRAAATPDDPSFPQLWGLSNTGQTVDGTAGTPDADIDAPLAWDVTTGSDTLVVAVADTGVAYDHPDLSGRIWANPGETGGGMETNGLDDDADGKVDDSRGWDFVAGDNDPRDPNGHGTHVAGTIGAQGNNSSGAVGVNWNVRIMPVRVLDATGSGTSASIADGFAYAAARGAKVVNASLGGAVFSQAVLDAINAAPETLFVVAAGNDGTDNEATPGYPCDYESSNIVCVAATDQNDGLAGFSNWGATSVDIGAPGVGIYSTQPSWTSVFSDDFSAPLAGRWSTGGTPNTWERVALTADDFALTDSPAGDYWDDTDTWAQTVSPIGLAAQTGCRLDFIVLAATEQDADFLKVETSPDGSAWSLLDEFSGDVLAAVTEDLSVLEGTDFFLRFHLTSNGSVVGDGAYVDDLTVKCLSATYAGSEFAYDDGTSMATPHVAGAAALVLAQTPTLTVAEVKARLLDSGEALASLAGKTVTGRRLNLCRAVGTTPSVTLSASPSTITGGSWTTLGGIVSAGGSPLAAVSVQIRRRPYGQVGFSVLRTVSTGADGRFSTTNAPTKRTEYRAYFAGGSGVCDGLSSARAVRVRPLVSLAFADSTIRLGQTATFRGAVSPKHAGKTVKLDRKSGTSWIYVRTITIASTGGFSGTYRSGSRGTFTFRVRFAGDADHLAAVSPSRTLRVS